MTNREMYDVIANVFANGDFAEKEEVLAFVEKQKAALDKKNASAKKRAAEKRAAGDAMRDKLQAMLTNEPKTVNDLMAELGDESVTSAKVVARMGQLVRGELADKCVVKQDGRKLVGYIAKA